MNNIFSTYQLGSEINNLVIELDRLLIDHGSSLPLGKKAEEAIAKTLKQSNRYDLIAHGLQIFKDKRTVGEIDFILKDLQEDAMIHLEFVYKFYLYIPWIHGSEFEHWIGPNFKDRLVYKLQKLKSHQFPIVKGREAIEAIEEMGIEAEKLEQSLCFLAELFVPAESPDVQFIDLDKRCVQGTWSTLKNFIASDSSNMKFYVCEKSDWLKSPNEHEDWYHKKHAVAKVLKSLEKGNSPMLWIKGADSLSKQFVIPDRPDFKI